MTPKRMAEIHAACFSMPRPWSDAEFTDLLRSRDVFLCEAPAGFALGRVAGPEAELLTLAVLPEARRQGAGTALVADFENEAKRRGATEAFLEVSDQNPTAIRLYDTAGYQNAGRRKGYYQGPDSARADCIVMRKDLTAE